MNDIWESISEKVIKSNRKKYILGTTKDSFCIFLMSLNENIYIEGFVETYNKKLSTAFNKKVKLLNEIEENTILLVADTVVKTNKYIHDINASGKFDIYIVKVHAYRDIFRQSPIFIYGAGDNGVKTLKKLQENNIEVKGFIESSKCRYGQSIYGIPIVPVESVSANTPIIISSKSYKEIGISLKDKFYEQVYVDYETINRMDYPYAILSSKDDGINDIGWNLYWHFHILVRDIMQKKIIIYGNNGFGHEVKRLLHLMDKKVEYFIDDGIKEHGDIKDKYSLIYEDMSNKILLVSKLEMDENKDFSCQVLNELEDLGLTYNSEFRDIYGMQDNAIRDGKNSKYGCQLEPLLGYSIRYPETSKTYNQYIVIGSPACKGIRVMILGGSTSDIGQYKPEKSWPEFLYEKVSNNSIVIFDGAIGGYNVRQECLKLLRDIGTIKPDIVISYSGVNDAYPMSVDKHPFIHQYQVLSMENSKSYSIDNGMNIEESPADLWLRMEQSMHSICSLQGCKFYGIFQPAVYNKITLVGREKNILEYADNYYNETLSLSKAEERYNAILDKVICYRKIHKDFLFDFSDVFKNRKDEIFKDSVHLYELGNEIIAEEISKILSIS